ncbi:MAG: hypothetical protein IPK35_12565 [Saprospiraceae bacterium]|nr:hypothetical protein [Saprospiraceae bacterium]
MESLGSKKIMLTNAEANYETQINQIEKTLNHILNKEIHSKDKKLHTLQKRLNKHQQYLLTFLKVMEVPPDNNFGTSHQKRKGKTQG